MTSFSYRYNPSILREYDIRGIVGKNLSRDDAYATGRCFGTMVARSGGSKVGVCYDGRHSSPDFAKALIQGLNDAGIDTELYGLAPTPLVYFGLHERKLDGAVAITGSHNPPDYNGIKMALSSGPVYGEAIQELGRMAADGDVANGQGRHEEVDITDAYIARLVADYHGGRELKIAWDAGNGAPAAVLKQLTDALPGTHILLFDTVDGDFPNHHPDPAVEKNLEDLKRAVIDNNCDLGIAFDGDGDRIGAVDKNGHVMWSDQLIALYAREILERIPNAPIILDIKCSKTAADLVSQWGGQPVIWKSGHSLVKAKMMETKAPLGGELSGHIFFKDGFYGHDDALYCAVRLLNIVQKYGDLHTLQALFPKAYNTPEIRFDVDEEKKFGYIDAAKTYITQHTSPDVSVMDIDGIRVTTPDGWWLLRASNTQNALTARAEATSEEALQKLVTMLTGTLDAIGCPYPTPLY